MRTHYFIAQLRFTCEEWDHLDRAAAIRRITIEELIREEVGLQPSEADTSPQRHLQLVRSEPATN